MGSTFMEVVLNNLMALLPFVIVKSYQRGVRWRLGRKPRELKPGFHWKIWIVHHIDVADVVPDAIHLHAQTLTTADGKVIEASISFLYEISDIVKHYNNVTDFTTSTGAFVQIYVAGYMRKRKLENIRRNLTRIEKVLEKKLSKLFEEWGTRVISVGFVEFTEVRKPVKLFTDGAIHL